MATAIVAISFSSIFIRLAEAPALTIATMRMALAVLLLLPPLLLLEKRGLAALPRRDLALCCLSGLFLALHFGLWTVSLGYTSVASSVLFVSIHPVLVAILGRAILGERPSSGVMGGIALAVAGSVLIGLNDLQVDGLGGVPGGGAQPKDVPGGEGPAGVAPPGDAPPGRLYGDLLAAGGAVAMVGYLLIGRAVRGRLGILVYSAAVYSACTLVLATAALGLGVPLLTFSARDLLLFFALAAVSTLGGHTVFNWALKQVPASVVAVSFVGEPAGSALLAWLILGEQLTALATVGGLATLLGVYLAARSRP